MVKVREQIHPPPPVYSSRVLEFSKSINVPPAIGNLLIERGIDTFDRAKSYFRPSIDDLHDPFIMPHMQKAVDRIEQAIKNDETIAIYGDYDVDGITSSALVYLALSRLGVKVTAYLPNRLEEGYGLSKKGIKEIAKSGAKLIITVDCGITACKEVDDAAECGLEVIITDHHEPGPVLPKALAILNPKMADNPYPEKELAGVGVAFKLVQGIFCKMDMEKEKAYEYLDLVALGSAADIVPLMGENRILVKYGFERMKNTANIGLRELIRSAGLCDKDISTSHIVFSLAPMINAVGRLGNPDLGFFLMITDSASKAENIVQLLRADNEKRKEIDRQVTEEAVKLAEETIDFEKDRVIVLSSQEWHSGVIGIVASRLVERFYRPTVLISIEDGLGKGSARSISGFHIYNALSECRDLLIKFGGHKYAAGISIDENTIPAFREKLNKVAAKNLEGHPLVPVVKPCGHLNLGDIDARFMRLLKLLEPYGPGNQRPIFYSDSLRLVGKPNIVGSQHLKFSVVQDGNSFDTIAFGMADRKEDLYQSFNNFGLAFGLEENVWNGSTRIQLRIKGIDL